MILRLVAAVAEKHLKWREKHQRKVPGIQSASAASNAANHSKVMIMSTRDLTTRSTVRVVIKKASLRLRHRKSTRIRPRFEPRIPTMLVLDVTELCSPQNRWRSKAEWVTESGSTMVNKTGFDILIIKTNTFQPTETDKEVYRQELLNQPMIASLPRTVIISLSE